MATAVLLVAAVSPVSASPPDAGLQTDSPDADATTNRSNPRPASDSSDAPDASDRSRNETSLSPGQRLDRAETAFRNAEFKKITELLRPTLEPTPKFQETADEIRARELLGVGYFLTAQRVPNADARDSLIERARSQFLALLRLRPDYELDPMVFPASVVDLFQSVRESNSTELEQIRRERASPERTAGSSTPIYIERAYERQPFALNFLPLGVGQFQNGDPVRGGLYAAGQVAALSTIGLGTLAIESLRNSETGRFQRGDVYLQARSWRQTQWIAAGAFVAIYAASVIDGILAHEPVGKVEIRTLDDPPPELDDDSAPSPDSNSLNPILRLSPGGLHIRW